MQANGTKVEQRKNNDTMGSILSGSVHTRTQIRYTKGVAQTQLLDDGEALTNRGFRGR